MKNIVFFVLAAIVLVFSLWGQEEDVIKLESERITDLEIEKSQFGREYNFQSNYQSDNNLFDNQIGLGLSDDFQSKNSLTESSKLNYFLLQGGSGYFFWGLLDFTQPIGEDWFHLRFAGRGYQDLISLYNDEVVENSKKYRFDVDATYQFVRKSDRGVSFLHSLQGMHSDYSIGLQDWTNSNDVLFYYNYRLGYEGYYLFPKAVIEQSSFIGLGKYSPESYDHVGFFEFGYDLKLSGTDKKGVGGLFGGIMFDLDWIKQASARGGGNDFRYLVGAKLGYDWVINRNWMLYFYLEHLSEIIKTPSSLEVDAFLPIVITPKLKLTLNVKETMMFSWEVNLRNETENLWQLYWKETFIDFGVFPYLNRLAEGKFSFNYNDTIKAENIDEPMKIALDIFAAYNYFLKYDRYYYLPGQLKRFSEDENLQRVLLGVGVDLKIFQWLSVNSRNILSYNILNEAFPPVDSVTKVTFSIPAMYTRAVLKYQAKIEKIKSQDQQQSWSLNRQRMDVGYEFQYRYFEAMLYFNNIFNSQNRQAIPDIRESGSMIVGGIKYHF